MPVEKTVTMATGADVRTVGPPFEPCCTEWHKIAHLTRMHSVYAASDPDPPCVILLARRSRRSVDHSIQALRGRRRDFRLPVSYN